MPQPETERRPEDLGILELVGAVQAEARGLLAAEVQQFRDRLSHATRTLEGAIGPLVLGLVAAVAAALALAAAMIAGLGSWMGDRYGLAALLVGLAWGVLSAVLTRVGLRRVAALRAEIDALPVPGAELGRVAQRVRGRSEAS